MALDKAQATLTRALYISTSGMIVQNKRMLIVSENLANAGVKNTVAGEMPYRRRIPAFKTIYDKKKKTDLVTLGRIHHDKSPFPKVYAPDDPAADKNGYVLESNVNPILEMSDMRDAGRSHEAATKAFEKILQMLQNLLGLLKQ